MSLIKLKPPTDKELRIFAVLQVLFFGLLLYLLRDQNSFSLVLKIIFAASVLTGVGGLFSPNFIRPIHRFWMLLVLPIGWVISHILMAVVYYCVVTPIGMWRRKRHGDPLKRQLDLTATTYWEERKSKPTKQSYFRQF
ncbi:SxtJ family membrane protein [Planctomicrobium sp.]|jgi:hypothetical protein|nr:SxtJ family membrane protein [Planctomicrobium sp.]MDB4743143.1 SxtJ family membrane protein [Planctomicrobium sp.]MDB4802792.1 SxtJ family membrane protein [bacterium]